MADHILWVASGGGGVIAKPQEKVGRQGNWLLAVRPGLLGLKVPVNCRGGKVRPEGSAHSCQVGLPRQMHPPAAYDTS